MILSPILIEVPSDFSFKSTVYSHGWCELPPFDLHTDNLTLGYVFADPCVGAVHGVISERDGVVKVELEHACSDETKVVQNVRHMLRLDDRLDDFYSAIKDIDRLKWVGEKGAGRLLRSPTVFEDLVKTICTTNCSWALTKSMVKNLVEKLGEASTQARKAFPTPAAMASVSPDFYRNEIRAGYRSPYFLELAESVASGLVNPEQWLSSDLPTAELKKEMKKIKGVGDYAAENLLKLVGRYDGLALDSWLRSQFYKNHNGEKVCPDQQIERHYHRYGKWRGLAIWCDMTEKWIN
ncbi:MAG: DNA-3-methyladenine glycosylase [Pyrinomonadaceae bacterium]